MNIFTWFAVVMLLVFSYFCAWYKKLEDLYMIGVPVLLLAIFFPDLSLQTRIIVGAVTTIMNIVALVSRLLCKKPENIKSITSVVWEARNREGKCGKCGQSYTKVRPYGGGGMCRDCWIVSH